jgi:peptidoglycan LD-endopeptidase LytH
MLMNEVDASLRPWTRTRQLRLCALFAAGLCVLAVRAQASLEASWSVGPALEAPTWTLGKIPEAPREAATSVPRAPAPATPALLFPIPEGRRTGLETDFASHRGRALHHAVDIVAPRQTPIHAATTGRIVRLHRSRRGGIGIEEIDDSGQYCLYYAHLQRYTPNLRAGQRVSRDQILGFVGSTGYARGPHLHFQVMKLASGQDCWQGTPLDPLTLFEAPSRALAQPEPPTHSSRHTEGQ